MKFWRILKWTLAAHLLAVAIAYFARPQPKAPSHKPMQAVTITLKPKPAPPTKTSKAPATKVQPTKRKTAAKKANPTIKKKGAAPKKPAKPQPKKTAPTPLVPLPIDYQQLLATRLKEQLELPEMGVVELKITFSPEGTIAKIETLLSESEKNARYLTGALKKIELPPLPRNMRGKTEPLIIEFSSESPS